MKHIIFSTLSFFMLCGISVAQTTSETLQLINNQNLGLGTARYNGLSGAFGALGGDLTAVSENPAGSAVFNNSYGSISLSQGGSDFSSKYFGRTTERSDANVNFNQIGGVLVLKNTAQNPLQKITLALNYNLEANYRTEYNIIGTANNSIGDYFVEEANGEALDNLSTRDNESLTDAYIAIGESDFLGRGPQQAFIALESRLISPETGDLGETQYFSEINSTQNIQDILINTSGTSGKFSFNLGLQYDNGLHLGANINVHQLNRRKTTSFIEENDFARIRYEIRERTLGNGISFNLGAIYKIEKLRLGASYESPTWFTLNNEITEFTNIDFENPVNTSSGDINFIDIDPGVVLEYPDYKLFIPGKFSGSLAYVFGKQGLLSFEYSRQDFSNTKYTSDITNFNDINNSTERAFKAVNSYRMGGEYRYINWRFRGGLNYSSSPYRDDNVKGDTKGFSLGTGYDWGKWRLDVGYNHFEIESTETTFENAAFRNTAEINQKGDRVSVTLGVNF